MTTAPNFPRCLATELVGRGGAGPGDPAGSQVLPEAFLPICALESH
jgi:hypothetical protein